MRIDQPSDGATLPVTHPIIFTGAASPAAVSVVLTADGRFEIGRSAVAGGRWTVARQFSASGTRVIAARELDAAGEPLETATVTIHLGEPRTFGYNPPVAMRSRLSAILDLVDQGEHLTPALKGLEFMCRLPGGEILFQSDLDLDTDGKRDPGIVYEATHQSQTSIDPQGDSVSSNRTPYFVLPGGFYKPFGIQMGDVAAILFRDRIEYAVFADTGPRNKIGEGSIALHRSLGFERIRSNGHILDAGIDGGVVTIVFPGSGNGTPQNPAAIREIGRALFAALGGSP